MLLVFCSQDPTESDPESLKSDILKECQELHQTMVSLLCPLNTADYYTLPKPEFFVNGKKMVSFLDESRAISLCQTQNLYMIALGTHETLSFSNNCRSYIPF